MKPIPGGKMRRRAVRSDVRAAVLKAAEFICHYCGGAADEADHIDPASLGGSDHPKNLIASCRPCNRAKTNKVLLYADRAAALAVASSRTGSVLKAVPNAPSVPYLYQRDMISRTITLPTRMLEEVGEFRLMASLGTDTEAVRQLLRIALDQKPSRALEERQK